MSEMIKQANIDGVWKTIRILSKHMPAGKRGLAYTVQDIDTEKAFLVEYTEIRDRPYNESTEVREVIDEPRNEPTPTAAPVSVRKSTSRKHR